MTYFYDNLASKCESELAENILNGLLSFRGMDYQMSQYPEKITNDLMQYLIEGPEAYYPCDVIELRNILANKSIFNSNGVLLFSLQLAKKLFPDYAVLIDIQAPEGTSIGGVLVNPDTYLRVNENLVRIYVNSELPSSIIQMINDIVSEECPEISMAIWHDIQSVREPVLAQAKNVEMNIQLSKTEQAIFDFLKQAKNASEQTASVQMRVAGGWTRDKLMGNQSDDIDIAISQIPGNEFAAYLHSYAEQNGIKNVGSAYDVSLEKTTDDVGEKNSQLFVGGIKIFGQKIEFVPMRTEQYVDDSRTPQIVRTDNVVEDAKRRDLTINSLYYNIETGKVEDYVNGIPDLMHGILRTPLDPKQTFREDPLRMLRVLRFHSRLPNTQIHPNILDAMSDPDIQSYYDKLAPERASDEFLKMMQGEKPEHSVRLLFETGLYKKVFDLDDSFDIFMDQQNKHHALTVGDHIVEVVSNVNSLAQQQNLPEQERAWLNISAMFHDFGKAMPGVQQPHPKNEGQMRYIGHDTESADFAKETMTRMGFPQDAKKFIDTVVRHHMRLHNFDPNGKTKSTNKFLGKFIRDVGDLYKHIIVHTWADTLSKDEKGQLSPDEIASIDGLVQQQMQSADEYNERMGTRINKPLIDGNQIRSILEVASPELVQENAFLDMKGSPKPVHFLGYAIQKMIEAQWIGTVNDVQEADAFVRMNAKNWLNIWKQQQKNRIASVSFNLSKQADASAGTDGTEMIAPALENEVGLTRAPQGVVSPYAVGDKVRLRNVGLGSNQIEGRVKEIKNNTMTISLQTGKYRGKTVSVDLLDAAKLSLVWEKV